MRLFPLKYEILLSFHDAKSLQFIKIYHLRINRGTLYSQEGYSYTILRPGGLIDGPPMMHTLIFDTGDRIATGIIDRSDVAEVATTSMTKLSTLCVSASMFEDSMFFLNDASGFKCH